MLYKEVLITILTKLAVVFDTSRLRVEIPGDLKTKIPSTYPNLADLKLKQLAELFGKATWIRALLHNPPIKMSSKECSVYW